MKNKSDVRKFLARHAADKAQLAKLGAAATVGCNHGFRKAARFSTDAELLSLKVGEDDTLRRALIFTGNHPSYQNGPRVLLPKYRRMLDRLTVRPAKRQDDGMAALRARVDLVNAHRPV